MTSDDKTDNVLFVMRYPLEADYNLKQKFDGQMRAVINLGYHVYHLAYDSASIYLVDLNNHEKQRLGRTHFGSLGSYRSTFGFYDLFKNVYSVIKSMNFKFVYMRSKPINRTALRAFKLLHKKGGKLIVEIPSYQCQEKPLNGFRRLASLLLKPYAEKLVKNVDLYTLIGPDAGGSHNNRQAINIDNGVCLDQIPPRKPVSHENEIHILALASMRSWQGYDRLIEGLAGYCGSANIIIHMVGGDGDGSLQLWRELAHERGLDDKVIFHGALYGAALSDIFNQCDIGAGTLGLHRKQSNTGSVLKSREYTARGLPFIYSYDDPALTGEEPFALRLPANDSPVDMERVVTLAETLRDISDVTGEMRRFAAKHMSWESQFTKVFDCVKDGGRDEA